MYFYFFIKIGKKRDFFIEPKMISKYILKFFHQNGICFIYFRHLDLFVLNNDLEWSELFSDYANYATLQSLINHFKWINSIICWNGLHWEIICGTILLLLNFYFHFLKLIGVMTHLIMLLLLLLLSGKLIALFSNICFHYWNR